MMKRVGKGRRAVQPGRETGTPGIKPISAIESKPPSDHNPLQVESRLAAVQNHPAIESVTESQLDDTQTHHFCGNSMRMSRYAVLSPVVTGPPSLSKEELQRLHAIAHSRDEK